jgi:Mn-dependent DtxR family transcriptional regulator
LIRLRHLRNRTENPSNTATSIPGLCRISQRTVQRRLAEAGLRARRPYRGPMLTQRHCQRRLDWARRHLRWRQVLFTDESRFLLRRVDGQTSLS